MKPVHFALLFWFSLPPFAAGEYAITKFRPPESVKRDLVKPESLRPASLKPESVKPGSVKPNPVKPAVFTRATDQYEAAKWNAQLIRDAGWRTPPPQPRYASPLFFELQRIIEKERLTGEPDREGRRAYYRKLRGFAEWKKIERKTRKFDKKQPKQTNTKNAN
jgi:hypothetical protein